MFRNSSIYIAGADTLIGGALARELERQGYANIVSDGGDLTEATQVEEFLSRHRPEYVFMAAGKSGGISANQKHPADLMLDNLLVESNVMRSAHRHGV